MKRWTFVAAYHTGFGLHRETLTVPARTVEAAWRRTAMWASRNLPDGWSLSTLTLDRVE